MSQRPPSSDGRGHSRQPDEPDEPARPEGPRPVDGSRQPSRAGARGGRRGSSSARRRGQHTTDPRTAAETRTAGPGSPESQPTKRRRPRRWLRQVDEFSAGGLVVDLGGTEPRGALIGRTDRQGRLLWSLPKGHIEAGETAEQAAVREVEEETGIAGEIVAELGIIDFWFVADGRRIHKTVRHYLLRRVGGELSDADIEVDEVAWVPLAKIRGQLAYPDERGLVDTAGRLLADTA